jgi:Tfp pilus assembly protein PilO
VKEIDFLPEWYKEGKRRRVHMRRQFAALTIIFLTMMTYNLTSAHKISRATAEFAQLEDQRLQAENVMHRFDMVSKQLGEYRVEMDSLRRMDSRIDLAAVLAEASHIIGRHVVLSRVEFIAEPVAATDQKAPGNGSAVRLAVPATQKVPLGDVKFRILLAGVAANPADVGELVCQLDRSSYFQHAHFSFARNSTIQVPVGGAQEPAGDQTPRPNETFQVTEFEITCSLLRKQQVWVIVIAVLFVADFVFYGYMPSHRRLQSLERARTQQERIISMAVSQAEALPDLEKRYREAERVVRYYEDCVPTESNLGLFQRQIADIMTAHQLTDQEVVPGKDIAAGELNCIPVHMNCKGNLTGIFGFFKDLQSAQRLVRIEKVALKNDARFGGVVAMQTEAVIFYRSQKAPETKPLADGGALETANDDA